MNASESDLIGHGCVVLDRAGAAIAEGLVVDETERHDEYEVAVDGYLPTWLPADRVRPMPNEELH